MIFTSRLGTGTGFVGQQVRSVSTYRTVSYACSLVVPELSRVGISTSHIPTKSIPQVANQLKLSRNLKNLNLVKKDRFRNYYTFYSYFVGTSPDQLSYPRVMLPSFRESARGVFWSKPTSTVNVTAAARANRFHIRRLPLSADGATFSEKPNLSLNPLRYYLKRFLSRRIRSKVKTRVKSVLFQPKSLRLRRVSKCRRRLFRVVRRLPGYIGYVKRRLARRCRKLNRLRFRLFRLHQRRYKRRSIKSEKVILRRPVLSALKRRISRARARRLVLPKSLSSKPHIATLVGHTELRLNLSSAKTLRSQSARPLYRKLFGSPNLSSRFPISIETVTADRGYTPSPSPFSRYKSVNGQASVTTASLFFSSLHGQTSATAIKYLLSRSNATGYSGYYGIRSLVSKVQHQSYSYSKSISSDSTIKSNLRTLNSVNYTVRRKFLRLISSNAFSVDLSFWYHKTLLQFIEHCSGRKALLNFGPFIENALTFEDKARCTL
jgi:hypothetical protein